MTESNKSTIEAKAEAFRVLHETQEILALHNAWDIASAILLKQAGCPAVVTTRDPLHDPEKLIPSSVIECCVRRRPAHSRCRINPLRAPARFGIRENGLITGRTSCLKTDVRNGLFQLLRNGTGMAAPEVQTGKAL